MDLFCRHGLGMLQADSHFLYAAFAFDLRCIRCRESASSTPFIHVQVTTDCEIKPNALGQVKGRNA